MGSIANEQASQELVDAKTHVTNHFLSFQKAMALKCALELGILEAMHNHGKPITLSELSNSLSLNPNKTSSLSRIMNLLVHSNFFTKQTLPINGEDQEIEAYDLTPNSHILLKDHPLSLAPLSRFVFSPDSIKPGFYLSSWFKNEDESPFHSAHGKSFWEYGAQVDEYNEVFNQGMGSDSRFLANTLVSNREFKELMERIESVVDVGGGDGTLASAIARAFPKVNCTVFDLPQVVKGFKCVEKNLKFVEGDMFEGVHPAQIVLLKNILHDWSDDLCVKILEKCKEAIGGSKGGKIVIIDMVVDPNNYTSNESLNKLLLDMQMMNLMIGGKERTEQQWKTIFINAGFSHYNILPSQSPQSVIVVYP
ncbi:unnamed protein product [Amaranthus hypochondriacus]